MGRPIKKSKMLANFNPGTTASIAVSVYRTGGSNVTGTGSYIVSQRGSKQFKVHLNDSSEEVMTLVALGTLTDNGTFNVKVILDVYDINGNKVYNLISENKEKGFYAIDWNAKDYSSGIYFIKITAGEYTDTKKIMLVK